jgi:bifunctional non-homologous end joining protein LigD
MPLDDYRNKRDFKKSPEPKGAAAPSPTGRLYVIQKHAARRLHYDLRLELDGVLKSWAVPKGPSLDPREKRLAVEVEDHPIAYGGFEGIIPENAYGAGTVLLWDYGEWEPEGDPREMYAQGRLKFTLRGRKLRGSWALARMKGDPRSNKPQWLLIKHRDREAVADDGAGILTRQPESVLSGRLIEAIAEEKDLVWQESEAVPSVPQGGEGKPEGLPFDPADLPQARKAGFPRTFHPQKAVSAEAPPPGDDWLHEIKHDGYRLLCIIRDRRITLVTRNGNDWTDRFPQITPEAAALPVENAILDGEVVVQRQDGTTDFQALQNYIKGRKKGTLAYFLFDLPYLDGYDLSAVPLERRKQALKALLQPKKFAVMRFGGGIVGQGETVLRRACEMGIEGIISKKVDAPYQQERSASWVKTKCRRQQEFVIAGYSSSEAAPAGLRSLLLGYHDPAGHLIYAGRVGTGFSDRMREELKKKLQERTLTRSALTNPPRGKNLHWAAPELVAEVVFTEWTAEGILRHPSFKGLREDKPALEVVLEPPIPPKNALRS